MEILWVENHDQFSRIAARQFLAGHNVTVVPSLTAARAALVDRSLDVVLIDFDLDDGKGDELVRELKALPKRPCLIATSSHDDGNRTLLEAGADAVCGKLQFARIAEVLAKLMNERGGAEKGLEGESE